MTIFFLVIGLEVKRELATGELSSRQAALLPAFAALGGVIVPALIFIALAGGGAGGRGWGIPMATDVAFALAALAALGARVPTTLVAFLLGVAVIDDIAAILVVAVYYTDVAVLRVAGRRPVRPGGDRTRSSDWASGTWASTSSSGSRSGSRPSSRASTPPSPASPSAC